MRFRTDYQTRVCKCGCGRSFLLQHMGHNREYYRNACKYVMLKRHACEGMLPVTIGDSGEPLWRQCAVCWQWFPILIGTNRQQRVCPEFLDPGRECAAKNHLVLMRKKRPKVGNGGYKQKGPKIMAHEIRRTYCIQKIDGWRKQCRRYLDCLDGTMDTFSMKWKESNMTCYEAPNR